LTEAPALKRRRFDANAKLQNHRGEWRCIGP
jgi:hypothetical protein